MKNSAAGPIRPSRYVARRPGPGPGRWRTAPLPPPRGAIRCGLSRPRCSWWSGSRRRSSRRATTTATGSGPLTIPLGPRRRPHLSGARRAASRRPPSPAGSWRTTLDIDWWWSTAPPSRPFGYSTPSTTRRRRHLRASPGGWGAIWARWRCRPTVRPSTSRSAASRPWARSTGSRSREVDLNGSPTARVRR